jgi:trk system potassium uptake protein TrkA
MSTNVLDTIPLSDLYSITQLLAPKAMVGKSLKELELRRNHGVNLITIKRTSKGGKDGQGHIIGVPGPDTVIEADDVLVLMGETSRIKKLSGE